MKLSIISTHCISQQRSKFMVQILQRIKNSLGDCWQIDFYYCGILDEDLAIQAGVEPHCLISGKASGVIPRFCLRIFSVHNNKKYDVVMNLSDHSRNWMIYGAAKLSRAIAVARIVGDSWRSVQSQKMLTRFHTTLRRIEEFSSLYLADRVICASEQLRMNLPNSIRSHYKTRVISPGVDTRIFKPDPSVRDRLIDILFVGRLEPVKDLASLFDLYEETLKHGNYNLTIVGAGSLSSSVEQYIAKKSSVTWLGEVPHTAVAKYMQNSKIVWLGSRAEGFGNVVFEGMACGCIPCVSAVADFEKIARNYVDVMIMIRDGHIKDAAVEVAKSIDNFKDINARCCIDFVHNYHSRESVLERWRSVLCETSQC